MSDTIVLRAGDIVIDSDWNCRTDAGSGGTSMRAERPGEDQSNAELVEDIGTRGVLHPPRVRRISEDTYQVTCGERRLKAIIAASGEDTMVLCTLQPETGDEEADAFRAMSDNLAENINRRRLRPWEIAEALYRLHIARPLATNAELAKEVGLSTSYTTNLVGIRKRACAELWTVFVSHGDHYPAGIQYMDFIKIVRRPKNEQLDAWEKLVAERTGGLKPADARHFRRASVRQLRLYLQKIEVLPDKSKDYRAGLKFGLRVALGRQDWDFEPAKCRAKRKDEEKEKSA